MYFFKVPRGVLKNIEYFIASFFWQNDEHKKKYRSAKMGYFVSTKRARWFKNLESRFTNFAYNKKGIWQELITNKYLKNKTLSQIEKKNGYSHFWNGLLGVKYIFLSLKKFKLDNGTQIRFWEDKWLGSKPWKSNAQIYLI